jgi:glycosyltransferase involved in cell wall biosynthesis
MYSSNKKVLVLYNQPKSRFFGGIYHYVFGTFKEGETFFTPTIYNLNEGYAIHSRGKLSLLSVFVNLKAIGKFFKFYFKGNFDILHLHTSRSWPLLRDMLLINLLFILDFRKKSKYFLHIHYDTRNLFDSKTMQKIFVYILNKASYEIIVLSNVFKIGSSRHCHVLNNYSLMEPFHVKKEKIILFVGSIDERKNVLKALEWFLKSELNNNWKFLICGIGEGKYFNDFLEILSQSESLEYLGYLSQPELNSIYAKSAVFILPSLGEGMPIAAIDAMLLNCVVLLSKNVGCHNDLLNFASHLLLDVLNDESCINNLNRLANESEIQRDSILIKSMLHNFTKDHHLNQLRKLYEL